MTEKGSYNNDDDIAFVWTEEQASISRAFNKDLIDVRLIEPDGVTIYRPAYLCFMSGGEITISIDYGSAKFVD